MLRSFAALSWKTGEGKNEASVVLGVPDIDATRDIFLIMSEIDLSTNITLFTLFRTFLKDWRENLVMA